MEHSIPEPESIRQARKEIAEAYMKEQLHKFLAITLAAINELPEGAQIIINDSGMSDAIENLQHKLEYLYLIYEF